MVVNYDAQKINKLLKDFYNSTGINMDLLKDDFSYINNNSHCENNKYCKCIQNTSKGKKVCLCSDQELLERCKKTKKPEMHLCHAGLMDVAVPIIYDDIILGYIIFGQMKTDKDYSYIKNYLKSLGLDTELMNEYFNEIPFFDSSKIQSISNIASMLVKHILLENMLKPDFDEKIQKAVNFIDENLEKELSIQVISKKVNVSKSVLYKRFHDCFKCTISEYINNKRIDKSVEFLKNTDLSMEEISQKVGFSSASYYGKIFKKQKGIAPLKYKKICRIDLCYYNLTLSTTH